MEQLGLGEILLILLTIALLLGTLALVWALISEHRAKRMKPSNDEDSTTMALREILRQQSMDFVRINQNVNDQLHNIVNLLHDIIQHQASNNTSTREEHIEIRKILETLFMR